MIDRAAPRLPRILAAPLIGAGLVGALAGCAAAATTGDSASEGSAAGGAAAGGAGGASYQDGSYTGSGEYQSPGGQESIDVKVTLRDDAVTAITVTPKASGGNAKQYQTAFASGISDKVVGKRIDQLTDVTRVSGSSLTSGGFQKAIEQIQSRAKK